MRKPAVHTTHTSEPLTTDESLPSPDWYRQEVQTVLHTLDSTTSGLHDTEAVSRQATYGPNELIDKGTKHPLKILWEQLTAVMVLILLAAAGLSLFLGKFLEAGAILAIVILFALLGFIQEYRAEKAIAALKKLAVPNVRVYRNRTLKEIPARDLVPGDALALEAGNIIPADVRILESANLRIQESALTGESEPIEKVSQAIDKEDLPLGDRRNMGYMGTLVTYGRATAVVVGTGMQTELGKIAALIQSVKDEQTPLQQRLDSVGKQLALAGVVVALLIMGIGLFAGETPADMLLTAISVAVAVIPEGLPAVVTFTLALGAQRMLKRNALIRKLPAVETLGSVTVICSDKTGTLTENRMTVTAIDVFDTYIDLANAPTSLSTDRPIAELTNGPQSIHLLLTGVALCNDAQLQVEDETGHYHVVGDPTEGALLVAANHGGLTNALVQETLPRIAELPFDSDRKRMTTVHRLPTDSHTTSQRFAFLADMNTTPYIAFTKGAVDGLLDVVSHVWAKDGAIPITGELRNRVEAANAHMASNGIRVLGLAYQLLNHDTITETDERDLVFVGLIGMIDPPRSEVRSAVAKCTTAGIRPIMITGDHPLTASYIARDLGIATDNTVVTGTELGHMSDAELDEAVERVPVFARVAPEHKLRIVEALQQKGHIVAMTGDGVNDAPALKQADIGVAMGITGTDVSKEAADMVLRDDNFATIVAAVEEGRVIYDNLRRFVRFAVAGNIGKVAVMLLWPALFVLLGMPVEVAVALLPLQLLWLNLMTDGLLGLSMGVEPAEHNVMRRAPHSPQDGIFSGGVGFQVAWTGMLIGAIALGVGFWYYTAGLSQWQTMMFTTLAFLQIFQALATRSSTESLWSIGVFSNRAMVGIITLVTILQLAALYTPLSVFLGVQALTLSEVLICVGLGSILLIALELEKAILRWRAMERSVLVQGEA
ncbi:MAG: cation-translocating P-type ATPase [Chloroflexi bacterium AL-W]|nr:cation-translocating P-type ATPase [Chloroflexi bacterium AL-N1]NOK71070.1 cation-translocating P-type ATPase [Chloroflexi bacterium AL-N10]NOK72708.1 cation-translocating P-type ATPase [Chloroflexi bacterium AL-N5]NOK79204.1 cation-translocating P-type ATPase [Chloroflexi bacterium AL-W]NOK87120.1 cation-translocating P-type ATPase [Chloroflexi bacterium AL-N15]